MMTTIIYVAAIGLFVGAVALVGAAWNHWQWARDGRPSFSKGELLQIDLLRAQGRTLTSARREVMRLRNSPYRQTMESFRDLDDLLENPAREGELMSMAPALTENLLAASDDNSAKQLFIEGLLSQDQSEGGKKLLASMRDPEKRLHMTSVLAAAIQSAKARQ